MVIFSVSLPEAEVLILSFGVYSKIVIKYIFDTENKNFYISAPIRLSVKFDHSFSSSWTQNSGENVFFILNSYL